MSPASVDTAHLDEDPRIQSVSFDELRMQVGTRLQMVLERDGDEHAHFTTVIGYAKDEYLIVRMPLKNRISVQMHEGESVRIRLFSGVHLYDFRSRVLRVFPMYYVHLAFPSDIRSTPVRDAPRVKADIGAEVVRADGQQSDVRIVDLSAHGAGVHFAENMPAPHQGDRFALRFALKVGIEERDHPLSIDSEVLAIRTPGVESPDAGVVAGVRFGDMSDADSLSLQNFVLRQIIEGQENLA